MCDIMWQLDYILLLQFNIVPSKRRYVPYCLYNLIHHDKPCAFEMAIAIPLMSWAPKVISMIKLMCHVIPASIADIVVDNTIWSIELCIWQTEPGNHHNRHFAAPGEPAQSGWKPHKEIGVLYDIDTFLQR